MNRKFKRSSVSGNSKVKEVCKTISLTEPDQSLTVREIMTKFANGTLNDLQFDYDYSEDEEDLRGYDPAEMHEMAMQSASIIKEQDERKSRKRKKDEKDKLRQEILDELPKPEPNA